MTDLYGVEYVVDCYEKKHHILLPKVPLCDANGTLVIVIKKYAYLSWL